MKDFLKKLINIREWEQSAKTTAKVIMAVAFVLFVLSIINVSQSDMTQSASEHIIETIEKEKDSSRKRVSITYNDFKFISYMSFSSSGAKPFNEAYVGFAGKIFEANNGFGKFTGQMVNYTYRMLGIKQNLLHGVKLTLLLTTLSILIGFVFSIFLALGKISTNKIVSAISKAYIFFFRGTPLLIQLFVIYFSIPSIFGFSWRGLFDVTDPEAVYKGAFLAALIAFTLNAAAYCAEIVRGAIQSIDKGQHEASKTLGLGYVQTMTHIILPQATRRMIPPLCNEFIMMIKDVSLVFAISLMDITTISKTIMTSEGSYLVFLPALIIYLIVTGIFTWLFGMLEERLSVYE
ncbi:MAG: amino acid ABC transporter permease [Spirochaetaceae bacterium]